MESVVPWIELEVIGERSKSITRFDTEGVNEKTPRTAKGSGCGSQNLVHEKRGNGKMAEKFRRESS